MKNKELSKLIKNLHCNYCGQDKKNKLGLSVEKGPLYQIYCSRCGSMGPIAETEKDAAKKWDKGQK